MNEPERIAKGKELRRAVLGAEYVDRHGTPSKFQKAFADFATEHVWANVWIRPGLELRERSIINLALLSALGRWPEFETHVRGALNNGLTEDEIIEVILHTAVYAGVPVAAEALRATERVVSRF